MGWFTDLFKKETVDLTQYPEAEQALGSAIHNFRNSGSNITLGERQLPGVSMADLESILTTCKNTNALVRNEQNEVIGLNLGELDKGVRKELLGVGATVAKTGFKSYAGAEPAAEPVATAPEVIPVDVKRENGQFVRVDTGEPIKGDMVLSTIEQGFKEGKAVAEIPTAGGNTIQFNLVGSIPTLEGGDRAAEAAPVVDAAPELQTHEPVQEPQQQQRKGLSGYERVANYMARNPNSEKEAVNFGSVSPERFAEAQAQLGDAVSYDEDKKRMTVNIKQVKENAAQVEKLQEAEVPSPRQDNVAAVRDAAAEEGQNVQKAGVLKRLANRTVGLAGSTQNLTASADKIVDKTKEGIKHGAQVVADKTVAGAKVVDQNVLRPKTHAIRNLREEVGRLKDPEGYAQKDAEKQQRTAEKQEKKNAPKEEKASWLTRKVAAAKSYLEEKFVPAAERADDRFDAAKKSVADGWRQVKQDFKEGAQLLKQDAIRLKTAALNKVADALDKGADHAETFIDKRNKVYKATGEGIATGAAIVAVAGYEGGKALVNGTVAVAQDIAEDYRDAAKEVGKAAVILDKNVLRPKTHAIRELRAEVAGLKEQMSGGQNVDNGQRGSLSSPSVNGNGVPSKSNGLTA